MNLWIRRNFNHIWAYMHICLENHIKYTPSHRMWFALLIVKSKHRNLHSQELPRIWPNIYEAMSECTYGFILIVTMAQFSSLTKVLCWLYLSFRRYCKLMGRRCLVKYRAEFVHARPIATNYSGIIWSNMAGRMWSSMAENGRIWSSLANYGWVVW